MRGQLVTLGSQIKFPEIPGESSRVSHRRLVEVVYKKHEDRATVNLQAMRT